ADGGGLLPGVASGGVLLLPAGAAANLHRGHRRWPRPPSPARRPGSERAVDLGADALPDRHAGGRRSPGDPRSPRGCGRAPARPGWLLPGRADGAGAGRVSLRGADRPLAAGAARGPGLALPLPLRRPHPRLAGRELWRRETGPALPGPAPPLLRE